MSKESQGSYRADPRVLGETDGGRHDVGRVAVPLASHASLIPLDVLEAYEEELRQEELGGASAESLVIETEAPGLSQTVSADASAVAAALRRVPGLEAAPAEVVQALGAVARQGTLEAEQVLFHAGELAGHVHLVLSGELERGLADGRRGGRVGPGECVGLFEALSGARRAATLRAIRDSVLLELDVGALRGALSLCEGFSVQVLSVLQAELVHRLLASPLFRGLTEQERTSLAGKFSIRQLDEGQALVSPGEVVQLLAVVLDGALSLDFRGRAGQGRDTEALEAGTFLLAASALTGMPARMKLWAQRPCTLALLAHKDLTDAARELPALAQLHRRAAVQARAFCPDLWGGSAAEL